MAALINGGLLSSLVNIGYRSVSVLQKAYYKNEGLGLKVREASAKPIENEDFRFPENKIWDDDLVWKHTSGFLRRLPEYRVPADVDGQVSAACDQVLGSGQYCDDTPLQDTGTLARLLLACETRLQHNVPNNMLHLVRSVGDVRRFYHSGVDTEFPLEKMAQQDLPKNLSVMTEYMRFNPETDTMFGGVSAYPESSTIVTNIKYKNKYPSVIKRKCLPWEDRTDMW